MNRLYTKEDVWAAVKEAFTPSVQIYDLGGQIIPVTNSSEDDAKIKKEFFMILDNIVRGKDQLKIELKFEKKLID